MTYNFLNIATNLILNTENRIQNLETGIIVLGILFFIVLAFFISFIIILEKQISKLNNEKQPTNNKDKSSKQETENGGV